MVSCTIILPPSTVHKDSERFVQYNNVINLPPTFHMYQVSQPRWTPLENLDSTLHHPTIITMPTRISFGRTSSCQCFQYRFSDFVPWCIEPVLEFLGDLICCIQGVPKVQINKQCTNRGNHLFMQHHQFWKIRKCLMFLLFSVFTCITKSKVFSLTFVVISVFK